MKRQRENQPFKGTEVSCKSMAALGVDCIGNLKHYMGDSLGVHKPNTNVDMPASSKASRA
jgi:hypothetical protein